MPNISEALQQNEIILTLHYHRYAKKIPSRVLGSSAVRDVPSHKVVAGGVLYSPISQDVPKQKVFNLPLLSRGTRASSVNLARYTSHSSGQLLRIANQLLQIQNQCIYALPQNTTGDQTAYLLFGMRRDISESSNRRPKNPRALCKDKTLQDPLRKNGRYRPSLPSNFLPGLWRGAQGTLQGESIPL